MRVQTTGRLWVLLLAAAVCGSAAAQPEPEEPGWGFRWEAVGDRPHNGSRLAVGWHERVWGTYGRNTQELRAAAGGTDVWHAYPDSESITDLVTGDTTYIIRGLGLGRGKTYSIIDSVWVLFPDEVYHHGGSFIRYGPPGSSGEGRLYVGSPYSVAYSDGRGRPGSWTTAPAPPNAEDPTGTYAADIAFFPADSPWPQRVVYAGRWGVAISDDRGATWRTSGLWAYLDQTPTGILTLARPGGGVNVVALGQRNGETCGCTRVYLSQDGGETWVQTAALSDDDIDALAAVTTVPMDGQAYDVPSYQTQSAAALLFTGRLWRTDDGGVTWTEAGQAPRESIYYPATDLLYAPDGRLYVSYTTRSPDPTWVWRTVDAFPVASADAPLPSATEVAVVTVRPNPASGVVTVAATLPASSSPVTVDVVDALGRRVATLAVGAVAAGAHEWTVDASGWPPGLYVARVLAGTASASAPFTLAR